MSFHIVVGGGWHGWGRNDVIMIIITPVLDIIPWCDDHDKDIIFTLLDCCSFSYLWGQWKLMQKIVLTRLFFLSGCKWSIMKVQRKKFCFRPSSMLNAWVILFSQENNNCKEASYHLQYLHSPVLLKSTWKMMN